MKLDRRTAVAALAAAGLLWGTTVPLTKLALEWLPPGWLTVARFGLAAAVLLAAVRFRVRAACSPAVLAWGAVGYGGSILVQNAGITRTSVSHAALLVGATPVLVAVIAAVRHRRVARPVAWMGFAVSFVGVGLVAAGGGGGATFTGDGLVLASLVFSASFTVAQARLLPGRDPVAVTAVQFLAAALASLPVAAVTEGMPATAGGPGSLLATAGLVLVGTLAPSTLFAYGQVRVSAEIAGAFVNLEPLVGAAAGAVVFGDPAAMTQAAGGVAVLTGIALSSLPLLARVPGGQVATRLRLRARQRGRCLQLPDQMEALVVMDGIAEITPASITVFKIARSAWATTGSRRLWFPLSATRLILSTFRANGLVLDACPLRRRRPPPGPGRLGGLAGPDPADPQVRHGPPMAAVDGLRARWLRGHLIRTVARVALFILAVAATSV
jgi:O-acetylserine/cysteine efflux transporter